MDEDSLTWVFPKVVPQGTPTVQAKGAPEEKAAVLSLPLTPPTPPPLPPGQERVGPLHPEQRDLTLRVARLALRMLVPSPLPANARMQGRPQT